MPEDFTLSAFLPYRLAVLSERVSRRLGVEYQSSHGLSVAEWRVMVHLQHHGAVSVRDIQTYVNLDKPRVSRAVTRLEAAGFLKKVAGKKDARLVSISLTRAGRAALSEIIPVVEEIEARLLAGLSGEDIATFYRVMETLHEVLDEDPKARARSPVEAGA